MPSDGVYVSGQFGHVLVGREMIPRLGRPAWTTNWAWAKVDCEQYTVTLGAEMSPYGSWYARRHTRGLLKRRIVRRVELRCHDAYFGTADTGYFLADLLPGDEVTLLLRRGRYPKYLAIANTVVDTVQIMNRVDRVRLVTITTQHGVVATAEVPLRESDSSLPYFPHDALDLLPDSMQMPPDKVAAYKLAEAYPSPADWLVSNYTTPYPPVTPPNAGIVSGDITHYPPVDALPYAEGVPGDVSEWLQAGGLGLVGLGADRDLIRTGTLLGLSVHSPCSLANTFRLVTVTSLPLAVEGNCGNHHDHWYRVTLLESGGVYTVSLDSGPHTRMVHYADPTARLTVSGPSTCCGGAPLTATFYVLAAGGGS